MVTVMSLWLPILLSAVFVFIVSSIIHMVLRYHSNDFTKLPAEDQIMDALGKHDLPPGNYAMPYAGSMKAMAEPAYLEKYKKGPVAFVTVMQKGTPAMGKELTLWFLYSILVAILAAWVAAAALPAGAAYWQVQKIAGTTAFVGYSLALLQNWIWYKRSLSSTLKSMFDGAVYGYVTGGTLGWLWPAAM